MKKRTNLLLVLLIIICTVVSVVVNIVAVRTMKTSQIMDCSQIGLSSLIQSNVTEIYVDEGNNPNLQGDIFDPEAIKELCNILKNGCYQKCSSIIKDLTPGSNSFPFVRLKTEDHTYAIANLGDRVRITIDGQSQCYYSNIQYELNQLINNMVDDYFID